MSNKLTAKELLAKRVEIEALLLQAKYDEAIKNKEAVLKRLSIFANTQLTTVKDFLDNTYEQLCIISIKDSDIKSELLKTNKMLNYEISRLQVLAKTLKAVNIPTDLAKIEKLKDSDIKEADKKLIA